MGGGEAVFVEVLIQGGAIGIAILMIIYVGWKDKLYNRTLNNHFQHFTEALDRNSKAMEENAKANGRIQECQRQTMKLLERVEVRLNNRDFNGRR